MKSSQAVPRARRGCWQDDDERDHAVCFGELRDAIVSSEPVRCFGEAEPTERFLGTASIHLGQLLMMPGAAFATTEFTRQVRAALNRG